MGKGKGKTKSAPQKGKGKGKQKGKTQWITDFKTKDGQWKRLCMRYQTGACSLGDTCKFHHACAYPVNGQACGLAHGALATKTLRTDLELQRNHKGPTLKQ